MDGWWEIWGEREGAEGLREEGDGAGREEEERAEAGIGETEID